MKQTLSVLEVKEIISNAFPDFFVSYNPRLKSVNINYRDVEFSITRAFANQKKCLAIKKYDRNIRIDPFIVYFAYSLEEAIEFIRNYSNIFENMYRQTSILFEEV